MPVSASSRHPGRTDVPLDRPWHEDAAEFHKSLDKYIAAATKVGGARTRKPAHGSKEHLAGVRERGKDNGFKVSESGRVSSELEEAYSKAN